MAEIYSELLNREDDDENIESIYNSIIQTIDGDSTAEVMKINSEIVKEAMKKIKPNKSDPIFNFTSDFLKNAPEILFEHLLSS